MKKIFTTSEPGILQRQSDEKVGEKHAFELLFLHAGLELFSDTEGATESLQVGA